MKRMLLVLVSLLFISSVSLFSQELKVDPFGVSPGMVAKDTIEHYFDRAYTGLLNVGKETKVYLLGKMVDSVLVNPVWSISQKPVGSNAQFGTVKTIDESSEIITFIPDLVGTYKLDFTDGSLSYTVTLNAGTYLGVTGSVVTCQTCHTDKYNLWTGTGHSTMLERGLNGTLSNHYGASCIKCHTVGYDADASNDGFDDFEFVFPDSLYPGVYDQMVAQYPEAMLRANIQCESCHGPGSQHYSATIDNRMVASIVTDACAYCHDDGNHHIFPVEYKHSKHSEMEVGQTRKACAQCHNGQGFIDYIKSGKQPLPSDYTEIPQINCAVCHDPHDATNPAQLRTVTATFLNGVEATEGGNGVLCINCHKTRRDATSYVNDFLNNISAHFGPHYGGQGDMLYATNAYTWGETLPTSAHLLATENACVDCHMSPNTIETGHTPTAGGHSFSMVTENGEDNVAACEPCHGNFGPNFSDKKFFYNGVWADLDGDGTVEGLQTEVHGLLEILAMNLPPVGSPDINPIDSSWTVDQAGAYYNYLIVEDDRSFGIHNPEFTYNLLVLSIEKLGGVVSVPSGDVTPVQFTLEQNYPNPFNPSTTINYSVPEQTNVKIVIYDAIGNQVDVLFDGQNAPGNYSVKWNAGNLASGIYFYKMQTDKFSEVKKMLLMK